MCGHFGYVTNKEAELTAGELQLRKQMVNALAISMQKRGDDGTGILAVVNTKEYVLKSDETAYKFIKTKPYETIMAKNPRIVMGHTRLATTGAKSNENSHPFIKGNIIGCHNGIVSNYREIDDTVDVDSEVIFNLLNKETDYTKVFPKLKGTFAITWVDKRKPESLHIVTYKNDDFYVAEIPELHSLFYCSNLLPLQYMVESSVGFKKDRKIWTPKTNTVYRIDEKLKLFSTDVKFAKEEPFWKRNTEKQQVSKFDKRKRKALRKHKSKMENKLKDDICGVDNSHGLGKILFGFWWNTAQKNIACVSCMTEKHLWNEHIFIRLGEIDLPNRDNISQLNSL